MIFPIDVHSRVNNQRKLVGENKVQLVILLVFVGGFFGFLGLNYVFNTFLGLGAGVTILVEILCFGIIFFFVFRFVIFDEQEKIREYNSSTSDSFAKYMFVRKDINHELALSPTKTVNAYEYINGSAAATIEFRYGSNDNAKSESSQLVMEKIFKLIASYGFESRVVVAPENFENSVEFRNYIGRVNKIEDQKSGTAILQMTDAIMQNSYRECNVDVVYLTIRSKTNYQRYDLEQILIGIFKLLRENLTSFRSVSFLNIDQLLEFYREFYGISAIDLSMMKTIEMSKEIDDSYKQIVSLFSLKSESGREFNVEGNENIFRVPEKRV